MNLVDSSGWLEYFADGENADFFAPAIEDIDNLIVSTINIYEIFDLYSYDWVNSCCWMYIYTHI